MTDYSGLIRGYKVFRTVEVGFYHPDGGGHVLSIEWIKVKGRSVAKLTALGDAWGILPHFSDLFAELAELAKLDDGIAPDLPEIIAVLVNLGIEYIPRGSTWNITHRLRDDSKIQGAMVSTDQARPPHAVRQNRRGQV